MFWWVISSFGAGTALAIVSLRTHIALADDGASWYPWSQAIWFVLAALVMLRAIVGRFHDLGWPSWSVLIMTIPVLSLLALFFLLFAPGQKEQNTFGDPPIFLQRFRKPGE